MDTASSTVSKYTPFILFSLIFFLVLGLVMQDGHNFNGDFALYVEQSKALISGEVDGLYEKNKIAMDSSEVIIGPYLYPFGYPILITPLVYLFDLNFIYLKIFTSLFLLGSGLLLFHIFNHQINNKLISFGLSLAFVIHSKVITYADGILSDFPFLFFALLVIFWVTHHFKTFRDSVFIGFLIFLAYLIRDLGILLIFVVVGKQLIEIGDKSFSFKNLKNYLPYLIFFTLFLCNKIFFSRSDSTFISMFLANLDIQVGVSKFISYLKVFSVFFLHYESLVLFIPIIILIGYGVVKRFYSDFPLLLFLAAYFGVLLFWPYLTTRFVFPLLPFLFYFFYWGLYYLVVSFQLKLKYLIPSVLFYCFLSLGLSTYRNINYNRNPPLNSYSDEVREFYDYIEENLSSDEIVVFYKPRILRLYTNRNAYFKSFDSLDTNFEGFILVDKNRENSENELFYVVKESQNYKLLKRN